MSNHPAKLESPYDVDVDVEPEEDYTDYIVRQANAWCQNPPPAPAGFELMECFSEPKHWPMYTVADDDFYAATCWDCTDHSAELREQINQLEHAKHSRFWRTKLGTRIVRWAYQMGVIAGSATTHNDFCKGCLTFVKWRSKRPYILGVSRDTWRCWRAGHRRGEHIGFGLCGKCLPCPDCGSMTAGHEDGCS